MIPEATLIHALERLPACYADRHLPRESKRAQYATIAKSLRKARRSVKWRDDVSFYAMMIAIGYNESRYCTDVHAGNCRPGTCGGGAAFGVWQVEPRNREDGNALVGLDQEATDRSAVAAAKILSKSWQCGGHPRGWFTGYAGRKCGTDWKTLEQRVATYWRVAGRLAVKGDAA